MYLIDLFRFELAAMGVGLALVTLVTRIGLRALVRVEARVRRTVRFGGWVTR